MLEHSVSVSGSKFPGESSWLWATEQVDGFAAWVAAKLLNSLYCMRPQPFYAGRAPRMSSVLDGFLQLSAGTACTASAVRKRPVQLVLEE